MYRFIIALILGGCGASQTEIDLSPIRESVSQWEKGTVLLSQQKPKEASAAFRKALQFRPDDPGLKLWLAKSEMESGATQEAILILHGLVEQSPPYEPARYNLAAYLARTGEFQASAQQVRYILAHESASPYEFVDDEDFKEARNHDAFDFLPPKSLEIDISSSSGSVFIGDELTVSLSVRGLKKQTFDLQFGTVSGPVRLLYLREMTVPSDTYFPSRIELVMEIVGPGTVRIEPVTVSDGKRSAETLKMDVSALAPPTVQAVRHVLSRDVLQRPAHVVNSRTAPAVWMKNGALFVLSAASDVVHVNGKDSADVRYEYASHDTPTVWVRRWNEIPAGTRVRVLRDNGAILDQTL